MKYYFVNLEYLSNYSCQHLLYDYIDLIFYYDNIDEDMLYVDNLAH